MGSKSDRSEFDGVWTAIATPFRSDLQIDWDAFEALLALQVEAKVKGVVIAGTTGESPTLSVQEKLSLLRKASALTGGKIRLMAGTGDNNTQQSIELSRLAQDAGADSLLVVTPPYNKPSTAGLVNHYRSIVDSVSVPVCLYHVPSRTAQFLSVDQIATVCEQAGIKTIKEASADVAYFSRVCQRTRLPVLVGDDSLYLASLSVGGKGIISVISNIFPKAMVQLFDAYTRQDTAKALVLHNILLPAVDVLFCEVNPCPLKAALEALGLAKNTVRAPLAVVTEASHSRIKDVILSTAEQLQRV